jgi:AcrR family transcriptional regulator
VDERRDEVGQRSDARRNRERILEAGRELFSDSATVPMYEVARHAGVGQATLYRHFPDRYALLDAIAQLEFVAFAQIAAQQADEPDGVILLLQDITERITKLRGLSEIIRSEPTDSTQMTRRDHIGALFQRPLAAAKAAGTIRADLEIDDVFRMIVMIEGAILDEPDPAKRHTTAHRAQALLIDGIRPSRRPGAALTGP